MIEAVNNQVQPALHNSRRFWSQSEATTAQRFYISFSLLVAAVQDCFLGRYERQRSNLNWSATCSYYGLVHAGRLFTFLALGDFPTQHNVLRLLFSNDRPNENVRRPRKRFVFDWLENFADSTDQPSSQNPAAETPPMNYGQCFGAIVDYYTTMSVSEADKRLLRFGNVLKLAAELRNDSNYEALLIAHEYRHVKMTSGFVELAEAMCTAGRETLVLMCDLFNSFISQDPDLLLDRRVYQSFLRDYLRNRVVDAISLKICQEQKLTEELRELAARLSPVDVGPSNYSRLEEDVSFHMFRGKRRLMDEFQNKLHDLSEILQRDSTG